jgi:hypothetical protein
MEPTIGAKRVSTVRRFGWLGVASMLALALLAPAASVAAALVTPTYPAGNPTCTELDPAWTLSFKIDTGDLENRAYDWDEGGDVESNWNGQTITLSGWSAEGQAFNWSSALPVNGVLIKGGNNNALYTYVPAGSGDTGLTHGPGQQAISHLLFCGDPTPPPTDPPVTAPPVTAPPVTAPPVTAPPVTAPPVTAPPVTAPPVTAPPVTAPPSQQVLAVTGAPIVTLPPTDSLGGTAGPSDGSWRLALMAMAALLASVLVLTPAKATNRRR